MANIEVVSVCNLNCPYCFAQEHLIPYEDKLAQFAYISLDDFEKRLDFLDRSAVNQVRLIGGEPTLHPKFHELLQRARARGKQVVIFSHGLMPKTALHSILEIPEDECTVLINSNASRASNGPTIKEQTARKKNIELLGSRVLLGYSIYSTNFDMNSLLSTIRETNCRKAIRVGLAHPILNARNQYVHPKQYEIIAPKLVGFARLAMRENVRLEFDCGFVRCMFSDMEIKILNAANADLGWHCNPIVDISVSGMGLMCFPTAGFGDVQITEDSEALEIRSKMQENIAPYRVAGIYPECSTCPFKSSGDCSGGGIENTIRRFQHTSFSVKVAAHNHAPGDALRNY